MTDESQLSPDSLRSLPKSVVIGTAGHIDHGKTALVRALTGIDTDRLPEEKRRGITIDLGFASLEIPGPDGSPIQLSLIDVPGHARFVRNMLAGAGGIDAVLLVISAEDGVKPQTEEHLAICKILGIRRGITVITKIDAVSETRLSEVRSSVQRFLSNTFLSSSPIVCVSAFTGEGVNALREELASLSVQVSTRTRDRFTRLPVDRAFSMTGFGAVITGTLISGSIATGQELAIQPGGRTAKVRGIQMHGLATDTTTAATRVALNLARIDASELQRGDMVVEPSTVVAVDTIDAEATLLPNSPHLKQRAQIHFHAFASECMATVSLYGYRPLEPEKPGLVRLRLSKPLVLLPGDRFVLRHGSPVATIGGGRVLDSHPLERLSRGKSEGWLQQIRHATSDEQLTLRVARHGAAGISVSMLSTETGLTADTIRELLASAIRDGSLILVENDQLFTREAADEATLLAMRRFAELSKENSLDGVKRSELLSQTRMRAELFDYALMRLEREKRLRLANELLFSTTSADPFNRDRERLSAISEAFEKAALAAPSPAQVAEHLGIDSAEMRRLITVLLREKQLVRLGDDSLCVAQGAVTTLKEQIKALRGQTIDVARFKQLTGVSRKYAIPLLEYLDRERITRKHGQQRIVL